WDLHLDRGRAYARQGSFDEASAEFDRSLALKDSAMGRAERAQLSELRNRHQQAISDSDKAIELDSSVDLAYGVRGAAYVGLKRYREALRDLDRYLSKRPDDPDRAFLRGVAYYHLGERDKALSIADQAVEASSRLNAAFGGERRLALFDLDRRRSAVSEALAKAEKAEADGDWTAAFYSLADVWGKTLELSLDDRSAMAAVRT